MQKYRLWYDHDNSGIQYIDKIVNVVNTVKYFIQMQNTELCADSGTVIAAKYYL